MIIYIWHTCHYQSLQRPTASQCISLLQAKRPPPRSLPDRPYQASLCSSLSPHLIPLDMVKEATSGKIGHLSTWVPQNILGNDAVLNIMLFYSFLPVFSSVVSNISPAWNWGKSSRGDGMRENSQPWELARSSVITLHFVPFPTFPVDRVEPK